MDAETYIATHWRPNGVWNNLVRPKHQLRFDLIAGRLPAGLDCYADVGCAMGHSTAELRRRVGGRWVGIDMSETAIAGAREEFPDAEFRFVPSLRLCDDVFPGVVCSEVIEHVPDDEHFAEQLMRIAGRALVVTTPSRIVNDPGHLRVYDEPRLRALFGPGARIESIGGFFVVSIGGGGR